MSRPSIRRTWSVSPAPSANAFRKRATRSVPRPPARTSDRSTFANLRAILEAAGSGLDRLVKTTVYLKTLDDFAAMNEVYRRHVGETPPARATIAVGLPANALVEIEAIALAS